MKLQLHATPQEVMRAVAALQQFGLTHGLSEKALFGPALSLEECGSNVVDHSLKRDARQTFQVQIEYADNILTIELRDRGPEFDPTAVLARKPQAEDDDLPGGWGIQLVRRYMDEIRYERQDGENVLSLKKKVAPASNSQ